MCRGNPSRPESMPGGTASQTFTIGPGVASLDSAKVQIDPDSSVTAHLSLNIDGATRATATATAAGDTFFSWPSVPVSPGENAELSVAFTATSGKIITVYTAAPVGGTFTTSNSCPDGAPSLSSANGLRAVVSGVEPVAADERGPDANAALSFSARVAAVVRLVTSRGRGHATNVRHRGDAVGPTGRST